MFDPSDLEFHPDLIDPPDDGNKFDEFCCEFVKVIWDDPNAKRVGVSGQSQDGVDITAQYKRAGAYWGVQSKKRSQLKNSKLNTVDIDAEVKKALNFKPPLERYEIFTTMFKDAALQEHVRIITADHISKGLFSVDIRFWEDIRSDLLQNRELLCRFYPHLCSPTQTLSQEVSRLKEITDRVAVSGVKQKTEVNNYGSGTVNVSVGANGPIKTINDKSGVLNAQMDAIKDLVDSGSVITAGHKLDAFRKDRWSELNNLLKYRLLSNLAVVRSKTEKEEEASKLFIEALQYNPDDEKALCNAATGYLLQENIGEAQKLVDKVLEKNPASDRAYSLRVYATPLEDLTEVIENIPVLNRKSPSVAYSAGYTYRRFGEYEKAIEWFQKAVESEGEDKDPGIKASLAETLLQTVIDDQRFVFGSQETDVVKERLSRSQSLFKEVWDHTNKEERKYKISWLTNMGIAALLMGDLQSSLSAYELALEIDPTNMIALKQKTIILFEQGKKEEALGLIDSIKDHDSKMEIAIPLVSVLAKVKEYEKAIQIATSFIKKTDSKDAIIEANRLIAQIKFSSGDFGTAVVHLESLIEESAGDEKVPYQLTLAELELRNNDQEAAKRHLKQASEFIEPSSEDRLKIELADNLYSLKEYGDAAQTYEQIVDRTVDSELSRKLLNCYYQLGRGEEALKLTESIQASNRESKRYIAEMRSVIFSEIGDWESAKEACSSYLSAYKDDLYMQIQYGIVLVKSGLKKDTAELDQFLKSDFDVSGLNFEAVAQLSNLYEVGGYPEKSLQLAYEARRKHFNRAEAHMHYIGTFFRVERNAGNLLNASLIGDGVSVLMGDSDVPGGIEFILDDRDDADMSRREINKNHALFSVLKGKKVGDMVIVRLSGPSQDEEKIKEVKSKYVAALHDSLNNFNSRFPTADGLWGIKTKVDKSKEGGGTESIQPILDQITKHSEFVESVERYYREGKLTIGAFAKMIGRDVLTVWGGLSSVSKTGVRASNGTLDEMKESVGILRIKKPQLVIDPISLMTIHGIGMADYLLEHFGKLAVSPATVALIRDNIQEKKGLGSTGYMTVGKQGDSFVREDITQEQIEENIKYLQGIIDWIDKNCEVLPNTPALSVDREKRIQDQEMLGIESYETVLIASQSGKILYSDDERLRSLAKETYNTKGTWTQLLVMELLNEGIITKQQYAEATLKLINSNYNYTSINRDVLVEAGRQSSWKVEKPLTSIMSRLRGESSDLRTSVSVAAEFLSDLWLDSEITDPDKEAVTEYLIEVLTDNRSFTEVIQALKLNVEKVFISHPRIKEMMWSIVRKYGAKQGISLL